MYEKSFGFTDRPFLPTPRRDRYHAVRLMENARLTLARSIKRGEGPGLLIGGAGTGKSLLCQLLAAQFADEFSVVQLASGRLATRTALLQAILYELGLPYRGMDEGELRLALVDFLEPDEEREAGLLLLVDEAQSLPLRLLEEIRLITNLVRDGQPRVRVVLAGSPQLEERFASPKLSTFAQRLAARCYLDALDSEETSAYVHAEIVAVGGNPSRLLDDDTMRSIHRASDGIPRLINQVCDHALMLASLGGATRLSSDAIEEAWADLQQLPTPWSSAAAETAAGGVIEFGQLDDASDEAPEAIPFRSKPTEPLHLAPTEEFSDDESIEVETGEGANADETGPQAIVHRMNLTEVDLDFPEFGDPHAEVFEEEEVVLDRYPLDADLFSEAPRVSSWESRQLASMLAAYSSTMSEGEPSVDVTSAQLETVVDIVTDEQVLSEPSEPMIACEPISPLAGSDFVLTSPAASIQWPEPHDAPPVETPDDLACMECLELAAPRESLFWASTKAADDEHQLIIIEDEAPGIAVKSQRRRPYRQLFAKLRRG